MLLGVVAAVLAAAANATGTVLQRMGARAQPEGSRLSRAMLLNLVRRPVWLAGAASTVAGLVLQALALANAPIVLVQSLLVGELGFVLVLSSVVFRTRLPAREWAALAGLGAGVALLLVSLSPRDGDALHVPALVWLLAGGVTLSVVAGLLVFGIRHRHVQRAALLGTAAGVWFGFTAVLVDGIGASFAGGFPGVFEAWQTYAMIAAAPAGFFLLQNALRAGPLVASQPGLTLANPLVALGWGVLVFHEQVRDGGWLAAELVAAALIAGCTLQLARSNLLDDAE